MKYITICFVILLNLIIVFSYKNREAYCDNIRIDKQKAIELANNEAERLGFDIESIRIKKVSKHNTPWNEYLPKESIYPYAVDKKNILKNKDYWAVYFVNLKYKKGGDFCIFIDSTNGGVITYMRWK